MRITIRLSHEDGQKLDAIADQHGMTISDLIRELIRNGYERHAASVTLEEIKAAIKSMATQKGGNGSSEDLTEIRRIVTLIAMAMPAVAKHL
jgi:metal-responsive CopG/Arc/MetJ family transcriptional regulator